MKKILLTMILLSVTVFANEAVSDGSTDIVQRTVNFLLFAGVIYYLVAEPIKAYFSGRTQSIADELDKVQEKLRESKTAKENALLKVEEAKKFAADLLEISKKENKILNEQIMKQNELDLENLSKQNSTKMDFEQRTMVRDIVSEIMTEALNDQNTSVDKTAMAEIIMKKVA